MDQKSKSKIKGHWWEVEFDGKLQVVDVERLAWMFPELITFMANFGVTEITTKTAKGEIKISFLQERKIRTSSLPGGLITGSHWMRWKMKRRTEIEAPYKTFTGEVLNARQCETYNQIQREINRWIDAGRKVPEFLMDDSHLTFNLMATLSKER